MSWLDLTTVRCNSSPSGSKKIISHFDVAFTARTVFMSVHLTNRNSSRWGRTSSLVKDRSMPLVGGPSGMRSVMQKTSTGFPDAIDLARASSSLIHRTCSSSPATSPTFGRKIHNAPTAIHRRQAALCRSVTMNHSLQDSPRDLGTYGLVALGGAPDVYSKAGSCGKAVYLSAVGGDFFFNIGP